MKRLGRRGAALLVCSLISILLGLGSVVTPTGRPLSPVYVVITGLAPMKVWGIIWILAGAVAGVQAFSRTVAAAAWLSVITIAAVWTAGLFAGWLVSGWPRGWIGGVIFGAYTALLVICAGWREPS